LSFLKPSNFKDISIKNGYTSSNSRNWADENQIVYHIDGVPTTHTGVPKARLNEPGFSKL